MQVLTIDIYGVELLDSYTNTLTQLVVGQRVISGFFGTFSQFSEKGKGIITESTCCFKGNGHEGVRGSHRSLNRVPVSSEQHD